MSGLIVTDPNLIAARAEIAERLHSFDLPLAAFTSAAPAFPADLPRTAFLRRASLAVLLEQPLPPDALLTHLSCTDPLPANVLRRYLFLRMSLMPYLRPGRQITPLDGCFLWGSDLLVVPVRPDDTVDVQLPPGVWTELTGATHSGRLRCMRGYNELPILARENALIPISINGQSLTQTAADDADRLTLHWFQPKASALCTLADGTRYHVQRAGKQVDVHTNATKPFHLIVHQDGTETLVR